MSTTQDSFDQPALINPNNLDASQIEVMWPGRYSPTTQSVSIYGQYSIAQNGALVGIVSVVNFH